MRRLLFLAALLVCASAAIAAAEPAAHPSSASILLHLHPRPWHPPATAARVGLQADIEPARAGLRTDVDPAGDGLQAPLAAEIAALRAARARALAGVPIQMRPDGSGFAVLGGLVRAYAVARIGPDGRLEGDCAHSEADALEWINRAAPTPAVKGGK